MTELGEIADEYRIFWELANKLTEQDIRRYPLEKKETARDRMTRHLIGMAEMYSIRYGDPEQRLRIVNFLERQLFRIPPIEGEVCHLTLDMWRDLKKTILSNEYEEPKEELSKGE